MIRSVATAFAVALIPVAASAQATPAPAATAASASARSPYRLPDTCVIDLRMSVAEAVGRPITDVAALRFVGHVGAMSGAALVAAAHASYPADLAGRISGSVIGACAGALASVIAARAFVFGTRSHPEDLTPQDQDVLLEHLQIAAGAIAARAKLTKADVSAALVPFGIGDAELDVPDAVPSSGPSCATPDVSAHVIEKITPPFVPGATVHKGGDRLKVALRLDAEGYVEAVWVYSSTFPPEGSPLIDGTLLAAMRSTYAPAIVSCVPVARDYLFVATFDS